MHIPTIPVFAFAVLLLAAGCRTPPAETAVEPADQAYDALMIRADQAVSQGSYDTASRLYGRAMDRAMVIDHPLKIARAALCRCAFALNAEEAEEADRCLAILKTLDLDAQPELQIRIADFGLRRLLLAEQPDEETVGKQKQALALAQAKVTGRSAPPLAFVMLDAQLTVLEAELRAGRTVGENRFPELETMQDLPPGLATRYLALVAWVTRDAEVWMDAIRRYSRAGNIPAALREARRCSEVLHSDAAATLGKRIAEGAGKRVKGSDE